MLLFAGCILLVALMLVSASQMVGASWFAGVLGRFPALAVLRSFTDQYASTLLFVVVVGLVYYFVPNAKVRFRDVWTGAILTGLLWKGALEAFSWHIARHESVQPRQRIGGGDDRSVLVYTQAVILRTASVYRCLRAAASRLAGGDPAAPAPRTQRGLVARCSLLADNRSYRTSPDDLLRN
jgi:membrane protein